MPLWRRRRPLHEVLADGTDLLKWDSTYEPVPLVGGGGTLDVLHGGRPRRWDTVVSAESPQLSGDTVHFVALDDGTLVVEERVAHGALDPLVDAIEQRLQPPYRAEAVRQDRVWAAAANRIEVLELPEAVPGNRIEASCRGGERQVAVDGQPSLVPLPTLEAYASRRYDDYVARAERIDGDLWEVGLSAL